MATFNFGDLIPMGDQAGTDVFVSQDYLPAQPVDTAGGVPGDYSQGVIDLFKYGIGAWQSNKAQTNQMDYLKWSTVNGVSSKNGVTSSAAVPSAFSLGNMGTMAIGAGVIILALVIYKKVL